MVSNMSTSSMYCSASDNRATSYDRAATINSATIVAASSAILVVRIAVGRAVVPAAYNCPSSNDSPPVNCGASVNSVNRTAASGPDLHKLIVIHRNCENAFGGGDRRTDRRERKQRHAGERCDEQLEIRIGQYSYHVALLRL
jgi:hypothetical protein